tara:strand:- start:318 stop:482 length:165 start_codon:yes stop_codon:yes gene_type:complete
VIRNIKGNISNIISGEFKIDKNIGKFIVVSISLKKSNSLNKFNIKTKLIIIEKT